MEPTLREQLTYDTQVQMVWPEHLLAAPPSVTVPHGLRLRTYQAGDEQSFYRLMHAVGWEYWGEGEMQKWLPRILPGGWFFLVDATTMAVHSHAPDHPFGGEVGWVAVDPAHQGQRLGTATVTAALRRLIDGGYRNIHLYSEDYRLPALKTYLRLGFIPYLYTPDMPARWETICTLIGWPYTPQQWRAAE